MFEKRPWPMSFIFETYHETYNKTYKSTTILPQPGRQHYVSGEKAGEMVNQNKWYSKV